MRKAIHLIACSIIWAALLVSGHSCDWSEPITIGFIGTLSGPYSTLSANCRDAVVLAFEDRNAKGGVMGRQLVLLTKSADCTSASVLKSSSELLDMGVTAVIGHPISGMATKAVDLFNKRQVVLISPTASTAALTGLDDNFFRMRPDLCQTAGVLGEYAYHKEGLRTTTAVLEESNSAYTGSWFAHFRAAFETAGGQVGKLVKFDNRQPVSFRQIAIQAAEQNPDGIVLACSAHDTALICQQLRVVGYHGRLLANGWALNPSLLIHGGSAVEGLLTVQPYDPSSTKERWLEFKRLYFQRFGREAGFEALASYNSALLLFGALDISLRDGIELKQAILKAGRVDGLQGEVIINKYGDVVAQDHVISVRNGVAVRVN